MLIRERELHMNENDFESLEYFPRFLIIRKHVQQSDSADQEWGGFLKDLKRFIMSS